MSKLKPNRSFIFSKLLTITLYMDIGVQIKKLRKHNKITRAVLAEELGISAQQLYKYETNRNKTPLHTLVTIALYFDVSLDYFVEKNPIIEQHQRMNLQEQELLSIFSDISPQKQKLLLNIARQFTT